MAIITLVCVLGIPLWATHNKTQLEQVAYQFQQDMQYAKHYARLHNQPVRIFASTTKDKSIYTMLGANDTLLKQQSIPMRMTIHALEPLITLQPSGIIEFAGHVLLQKGQHSLKLVYGHSGLIHWSS